MPAEAMNGAPAHPPGRRASGAPTPPPRPVYAWSLDIIHPEWEQKLKCQAIWRAQGAGGGAGAARGG